MARLMLRSMGPDWSQAHMEKAHKRPVEGRRDPSYTYQTKPLQMDGITMAVLGVAALAALKGYLWVQAGETWKAALMGIGVAAALAAGGWLWHRWKRAGKRVYDPLIIKEKVSRIAFDGELQLVAVLPGMSDQKQARERARSDPSYPTHRRCTPQAPDCSASAASWVSGRRRPYGTRRGPGTRRPWWSGPGQGC